MPEKITLQIAQRGLLTLPKAIRDEYQLKSGDELTLLDLGGVFLLTPRRITIDTLADQISESLREKGETLESMLSALREARERYDS